MADTIVNLTPMNPNYSGQVLSQNVDIPAGCWDKVVIDITFDIVLNVLTDATISYNIEVVPGKDRNGSLYDRGVGCRFQGLESHITGSGYTAAVDLSTRNNGNDINLINKDGWILGALKLAQGTTIPLYFEWGNDGLNNTDTPTLNHSMITITAITMTFSPSADLPIMGYDGTLPSLIYAEGFDSCLLASWQECQVQRFKLHTSPLSFIGNGGNGWQDIQEHLGYGSHLANNNVSGYGVQEWSGLDVYYMQHTGPDPLDPGGPDQASGDSTNPQFRSSPPITFHENGLAFLATFQTSTPNGPLFGGFGGDPNGWKAPSSNRFVLYKFVRTEITPRHTTMCAFISNDLANIQVGEFPLSDCPDSQTSATNPFLAKNMLAAYSEPGSQTFLWDTTILGPFFGAVCLPQGFGLLYNRNMAGVRKTYWKYRPHGPNNYNPSLPAPHGVIAGSADDPFYAGLLVSTITIPQVVGLVRTSEYALVGLLWDWDGYSGTKEVWSCWSTDGGDTWEQSATSHSCFGTPDAPPFLTVVHHVPLAVMLVSGDPVFFASTDIGQSWS